MKRIAVTVILSVLTVLSLAATADDAIVAESAQMLKLKDSLQKDIQRQNQIKQTLETKINSLATMMKEFDDASTSMNGISGLGRIEQMQFKAERYSAERQVRKQIEKEVLGLAAIMAEFKLYDDKVKEWNRLINLERKVQELKITLAKDEKGKDDKGKVDLRNIEYYTVKQSADLKTISGLQEVYGNPAAWKYIFDANRDKIVNPNSIVPAGTTLTVPNIKTDKVFINLE